MIASFINAKNEKTKGKGIPIPSNTKSCCHAITLVDLPPLIAMIIDQQYHPSVDFEYPDDEPEKQENALREACLRYLTLMDLATDYVASSQSPQVAAVAVQMALGLPSAGGKSVSDTAAELNIGCAALSKQIRHLINLLGVDESAYSYKKK